MKKIYGICLLLLVLLVAALPAMADSTEAPAPDTTAVSQTASPVPAGTDSLTFAAPYAVAGCYWIDFEHNLNDTSSFNISGLYMGDGILKELWRAMFGVDLNIYAVDAGYKYYPGGAQNGLYYGADLMFSHAQSSNSDNQSNFYQAGPCLGFRKITGSGLTFDLGAIGYYSFAEKSFNAIARLNIGFGW